jgi:hypothetical protein
MLVSKIGLVKTFVGRIEAQLVGAHALEIRRTVDGAYERIVQAMFEALQQMAKMDGSETKDPDDKGVLNYHVIMIGVSFPARSKPPRGSTLAEQKICIILWRI